MNLLKNNKAFTLVEILVAVGLTSIVAIGVTSLISNSMKAQRGVQAKDIQREVMSEITSHLGNKTACFNSFGGSNPSSSFTKSVIKDALNSDKYTVGAAHASNLVQYKEFKIENWQPDAGYTNQGKASLSVKLFKLGDVIGVRDIEQKIGLIMKLDASNNISECFSVGTNANGFWLASATNPSDIYYSGGNVGIGTTLPYASIHVNGPNGNMSVAPSYSIAMFQSGSSLNTDYLAIGSPAEDIMSIQAGDELATRAIALNPQGGNVGIGTAAPATKLDVAGGVKIGSENTCNGGTEGTLRYNSGTKQMEFCNGISWASMGGSDKIGKILWVSGWSYGCETGYHPAGHHANVGNSNNTIVMQCVKDGF